MASSNYNRARRRKAIAESVDSYFVTCLYSAFGLYGSGNRESLLRGMIKLHMLSTLLARTFVSHSCMSSAAYIQTSNSQSTILCCTMERQDHFKPILLYVDRMKLLWYYKPGRGLGATIVLMYLFVVTTTSLFLRYSLITYHFLSLMSAINCISEYTVTVFILNFNFPSLRLFSVHYGRSEWKRLDLQE